MGWTSVSFWWLGEVVSDAVFIVSDGLPAGVIVGRGGQKSEGERRPFDRCGWFEWLSLLKLYPTI